MQRLRDGRTLAAVQQPGQCASTIVRFLIFTLILCPPFCMVLLFRCVARCRGRICRQCKVLGRLEVPGSYFSPHSALGIPPCHVASAPEKLVAPAPE